MTTAAVSAKPWAGRQQRAYAAPSSADGAGGCEAPEPALFEALYSGPSLRAHPRRRAAQGSARAARTAASKRCRRPAHGFARAATSEQRIYFFFAAAFFAAVAERKLAQLDAAQTLEFMRAPPGNHLEALKGDRKGQCSIRINDQWRICFVWTGVGPTNVEISGLPLKE